MTALRIAEEVVMQQLAWVADPSLPLDEARQEWNQTTPNDENLITWAERMQDAPDLMPSTVDLEQKAKDWAVPVWFLEGLVEAEIPRRYLEEHQSLLAEAASMRFLREVRPGAGVCRTGAAVRAHHARRSRSLGRESPLPREHRRDRDRPAARRAGTPGDRR
jgi:hypothetical protein